MLRTEIETLVGKSGGEVSVYYQDLGGPDSLLLDADRRMHAASTMKVPVMIQVFEDQAEGLLSLDERLEVKRTFSSIVDGSPYALEPEDDSETSLYDRVGGLASYRELIELMITVSSNLATNLLVEEVGAERVTESMRALGADSIMILRGVEDGPAFRAGLSNTTTARDLGIIMSALGRGEVVSEDASGEMIDVLARQKWRNKIPAGLPEGVRVAHKTGWITGINHDFGVVFPPAAPPYALVVLTRGIQEAQEAERLIAEISRLVFRHHLARHPTNTPTTGTP